MITKILMIEDEQGLVLTVGDRLKAEGYHFVARHTGNEGEMEARKNPYDLIILDIMLPGKDGFSICKSLRDSGVDTPILMLTARSQVEDRVTGLKIGADDYLCKPFDMNELLARIEALLRRSISSEISKKKVQNKVTPSLSIDLEKGIVIRQDKEVPLSAQEIKLLQYLYLHYGTIVSRKDLLNNVWGYEKNITTRTVDVHVARLRQKLGDIGDMSHYIHTIRGIGYKFSPPEA